MTDRNAQFAGTIPAVYDQRLGPVLFEPYAADLARRIAVPPGGHVLEVACGTGIVTRHLRERLAPTVRLTATDLNQAMIDYARSKPRAAPADDWKAADACSLPFPDASFDALVCQFGIMFVPDKAVAMCEARRVLKRRGSFSFNVWGPLERNPIGRIAHGAIAGFFERDPPDFYLVPFGFHDPALIRRMLGEAGFGSVDTETVRCEATSPSAHDLAVGLVEGNPVSMAIRERGVADLGAIVAAVEKALVAECGDRPLRTTMEALIVTAW